MLMGAAKICQINVTSSFFPLLLKISLFEANYIYTQGNGQYGHGTKFKIHTIWKRDVKVLYNKILAFGNICQQFVSLSSKFRRKKLKVFGENSINLKYFTGWMFFPYISLTLIICRAPKSHYKPGKVQFYIWRYVHFFFPI